jgi:hypothetical protein
MTIPRTNFIDNVIQTKQLITKTLLTNMTCIPRPARKGLNIKEKIKTPWDFFKSVFKDYKPDNPELLDACFEYDWSCTKIEKIVKDPDDQAEVKAFLKSKYPYL